MNARTNSKEKWLNRTVLGVGLTSGLGDICYETATVILPGFLSALGLPPATLGMMEGAAGAVADFTKMFSGHIADKLGHRKALAVLGYALTPLGQALMALTMGWPLLVFGRALGWFGKGLRGPLRNVILSQSVLPTTRGRAFGFHRAMDTLGAIIGPALGVMLLGYFQNNGTVAPDMPFRWVLTAALLPGMLAAATLALMVQDTGTAPNPQARFWAGLVGLPASFKRYLTAIGLFGLGDFSHTLLIQAATAVLTAPLGLLTAAKWAGALYIARNAVEALSAFPIGWLADKVGARRVLLAGYGLGVLMTGLTVALFVVEMPAVRWMLLTATFIIAGIYIAVQEALEPVLAAQLAPTERQGIAFGALGTVNGLTRLASSAAVGIVWTAISPIAAFALAGGLMAIGTVTLWLTPADR